MNTPAFTTDLKRIARLQANYDAGFEREKIPHEEREKMDVSTINCDAAYINALHKNIMELRASRAKKATVPATA